MIKLLKLLEHSREKLRLTSQKSCTIAYNTCTMEFTHEA